MADNNVIQDIKKKIEREKKVIAGAMAMSKSTENSVVQAQADNQIRESRRNINYFEEKLHDLTERMNETSLSSGQSAAPNQNGHPGARYANNSGPFRPQDYDQSSWSGGARPAGDYRDVEYSSLNNPYAAPPRQPFPPGPTGPRSTPRPNYSRLDLIKYDTQHLGPKIQYMLSQLEFKLSVEKQYKDGIEKIRGSYGTDGDRKIRKETEARLIESVQKIELLKRSLKRYEDLHIMDVEADTPDDDSLNAPSMRKPLTGELYIQIHAVSDVTHYQTTGRFGSSKSPETFVTVKVEDDIKLRTRTTRIDRWPDESLPAITIDQGNEVELTVFDKTSDVSMPIGLIWIRISDLVEEIRRKRIETELQASGWVAADRAMEESGNVRPDLQFNPPPGSGSGGFPGSSGPGAFGSAGAGGSTAPREVVIDSWFALEPVGRIHLSLGFSKQTHERQKFDNGLNRKGAIRQRKEEVRELYGHKFVEQQFYNIMRCALCGELLKYATGMQCADCKYMCHEKCYPLVVTKCISKSNAETDPDEAKLNYRIPHRFDAYKNIGANWCCHCGYMLPLGRKNCRRCRECKLACHAGCQHLVPDFCGMSMKDAGIVLDEIRNVSAKQQTRTTPRPPGKQPPRPLNAPAALPQTLSDPGRPLPQSGRLSYGKDEDLQQQQQQQQSPPPSASSQRSSVGPTSAAASAYSSGGQPNMRQSHDPRPTSGRHGSATALAAAAAAGAMSTATRPAPPRTGSTGYSPDVPTQQPPTPHTPYNPSDYAAFEQQRQYSVPAPAQSPVQVQQQMRPPAPQAVYSPDPSRQAIAPVASTPVQTRPDSIAPPDARDRSSQSAAVKGPTRRIGLDHFNFLAVLGKGNFGKVMLAETKSTKKLYAIKVLKKEFIIENDEVESTRSERDVFIIANKARHPFLLNLHACFQTETRVYFVMEYISGGDLMLHIQRGQFGTKRAQFYAAEVCLALKYFHENGVVYRDLKLDNIMLTMDGHIKVADYGLCKKDMFYGTTTRTFCGTPEFMAPEILLDKPYGRAVDWWAFGVLIYQMLLQQSPFRGEDEDEIYDAILADEPLYPIHMPRDSVSILQKLLTREPELRLGSGPTDAQEIMSHAFFRNINWDDIANKRVPAPFLPQIKNATDTSNFDSEFTSVTPVLTPVQSVLTQAMQEEFRGFSYSADFV